MSSNSSRSAAAAAREDSGELVASVIQYGATPFVIGRLVLADSAASSDADKGWLLRRALTAIKDVGAIASYLTTPAGFHHGMLPASWSGLLGWKTREEDFESLLPIVQGIARELAEQSGALGGPARYLSLGIDLKIPGGKAHVETSVLYDTVADDVVGVTGKSYPTTGQERSLVRNTLPANHIVKLGGDRALTLVCHDLSMFHPRGRAVRTGTRDRIGDQLQREIRRQQPTIALHQAHTVESPATWTLAWNAFCKENGESLRGWTTAFRYLGFNGVQPEGMLSRKVLERTRGGTLPAIDVVLSSQATARRLT